MHEVHNYTVFSSVALLFPLFHLLVDLFPMHDPQDDHIVILDPVDHPVVPYPELPVTFQTPAKRVAVIVGSNHQAFFDGFLDPYPCSFRKGRDVLSLDGWMVPDPEPDLRTRHRHDR